MKEFTGFDWPNVIRTNGYERNCLTNTIHKFDLISRPVFVNVDDRTNVTAIQFRVWRVAIQYDK